jgi:hypothetical protein
MWSKASGTSALRLKKMGLPLSCKNSCTTHLHHVSFGSATINLWVNNNQQNSKPQQQALQLHEGKQWACRCPSEQLAQHALHHVQALLWLLVKQQPATTIKTAAGTAAK